MNASNANYSSRKILGIGLTLISLLAGPVVSRGNHFTDDEEYSRQNNPVEKRSISVVEEGAKTAPRELKTSSGIVYSTVYEFRREQVVPHIIATDAATNQPLFDSALPLKNVKVVSAEKDNQGNLYILSMSEIWRRPIMSADGKTIKTLEASKSAQAHVRLMVTKIDRKGVIDSGFAASGTKDLAFPEGTPYSISDASLNIKWVQDSSSSDPSGAPLVPRMEIDSGYKKVNQGRSKEAFPTLNARTTFILDDKGSPQKN